MERFLGGAGRRGSARPRAGPLMHHGALD